MNLTPPKPKVKRCDGLIIENGGFRRRWIDEITLHVHGKVPRTLRGEKLPVALVLNTGASQEAETVLEFFYEKVPRPLVVQTLPVERPSGPNGRDALVGIAAVIAFQVLLAFADAIAKAAPF
jgi:hypothetical protein